MRPSSLRSSPAPGRPTPGRRSRPSVTAQAERSVSGAMAVQVRPSRPATTRPGSTRQQPAGFRGRATGPRSPSGGKARRHAVRPSVSVDLGPLYPLTRVFPLCSPWRDVLLHRRLSCRRLRHGRPLDVRLHADRRVRFPSRHAPHWPPATDAPLPQQRNAPSPWRLRHGLALARTPIDRLRA